MIDHETLALDRELSTENELRNRVARLSKALDHERDVSADWKASSRKWEGLAKQFGPYENDPIYEVTC